MRIADRDCGGWAWLAAAVADELEAARTQGEEAGGKAAHGEHQGEPAAVGVRALAALIPPKTGEDERGRR